MNNGKDTGQLVTLPSVTQISRSARTVRLDIEGLRALAVLAVVVNHIRPSAMQGGFAGVDCFFVISGFLIGRHLLQDIRGGSFSFLSFYGRRARRLLPALIVMLLAVWAIGWNVLSGPEFVDLGKHIAAAAVFANNILLWAQSGYFDAPAAAKPLLHLWSLGVEEQFYLLVPALLWLSSNGRRPSIAWALRLSAISGLLTILYPLPSFYLLDTRFWELGVGVGISFLSIAELTSRPTTMSHGRRYGEFEIFAMLVMTATALTYLTSPDPWGRSNFLRSGALIAIFSMTAASIKIVHDCRDPVRRDRWHSFWKRHECRLRDVASIAGIALVAASFSALTPLGWPGPQTVFPVMGAALLIMAGPAAIANTVLANRLLVFFGAISYPLYLWHWPAIVLSRLCGFDSSPAQSLLPLVGAVVLAWLTTEFIEKPVRFGGVARALRLPSTAATSVLTALLVVLAAGITTVATGGFPTRFPPSLRAIANWSMPLPEIDWRPGKCFLRRGSAEGFASECMPPRRTGVPQILIWGDSHAGHLYPGLLALHATRSFDIAQWSAAACPPVRAALRGEDQSCAHLRANVLMELPHSIPDTVLLAAAWEMYIAQGTSEATLIASLDDDIRWLRNSGAHDIVLFGPVPSWPTSAEVFAFMLRHRLEVVPERLGQVSSDIRALDAAMAAEASAEHIKYVSVIDRFCNDDGCLVLGDPRVSPPDLLYRDHDHLTPSGSRLLMNTAAKQIFDF